MIQKKIKIFIISTILLFATQIFAQTLSLQDCIKLALKENNKIKSQKLEIEKDEEEKKATFYQFFPSSQIKYEFLKIEYAPTPPDSMTFEVPAGPSTMPVSFPLDYPSKIHDLSIEAGQPLTPLWSIYKAYNITKIKKQISKLKLKLTKNKLKNSIITYYYNYLLLEKAKNLLIESKKQIKQYEKTAQNFVDAKMTDKRGVLKLKISELQIEKQIKNTKRTEEIIKTALAILMNKKEADFELQKENFSQIKLSKDEKDLITLQNNNRIEFKLFKKVENITQKLKEIAYQPFIPSLVLVGSYKRNFSPLKMNPVKGNFAFGITLSFPIFANWGTSFHKLNVAKANIVINKLKNKEAKNQMKLQIKSLYSNIKLKEDEIKIAKQQIEEAKENLKIEEDKYSAKMTTETDLLKANMQLLKAKTELAKSYFEYKASIFKLANIVNVEFQDIVK